MRICEAGRDSCGCDNWKKGIRTINGQYPDDNRDFDINAGPGVSITPATAGITVGLVGPLPGGMTFMGTVGTGGTIATLPNADIDNRGFCYVAVSAGTTPDSTPKSYDLGDTLVSNGVEWIVIPSGNDPVDWSDILNKPTTVAGYGITDAVNTTGAQTAAGAKTWSGQQIATGQRTYNASNTTDIMTIGMLQASSDVVHKTGNENIAGQKFFTDMLHQKRTDYAYGDNTVHNNLAIQFDDMNDNLLAGIACRQGADNTTSVILWVRNADGTIKYITIGAGNP